MNRTTTILLLTLTFCLAGAAVAQPYGVAFTADRWGAVVPVGETSRIHSQLENTGTLADVYDVHFSEIMPGGWSLAACAGTTCYPTFVRDFTVSLGPGETVDIALDVEPDGSGSAEIVMTVTSRGDGAVNAEREFLAVAPGDDVLLVDADDGAAYETYLVDAAVAAGASVSTWDRQAYGHLLGSELQSFPHVIWHAGTASPALTAVDRDALTDLLAVQGDLLLSGQNVAYDLAAPSSPHRTAESQAWYETYTGASFVADDSQDMTLVGVGDDPVGIGLVCSLAGGTGADNQTSPDVLLPAYNARGSHHYSTGDVASVRFLLDGAHVVTLGFGFEGVFNETSRNTMMNAILAWFLVDSPAAVDDESPPALGAAPRACPNPFNPATEIVFSTTSDRVPTTVAVYDVQGRLVRTLWDGVLDAGEHALRWDGRRSDGRAVASGAYLARVRAGDDERSTKLILSK